MDGWLKQSTTVTIQMGPALDKTDGVTEETGLSPTVEVSKAGAAFAARSSATAITHDANGWYRVELNTTDTGTLGILKVKFDDAATHLPVWHTFMVVPANIYDSLVGGSDLIDVSVTQWLGTAAATPTVAGVPEVDLTHLGGVAQSAADLKDFADDGYDPATNKVQGVVLTDTLTTYTGNTPQTGDSFARLGAPAGASVSADIAAIEAQTDDIGAAGAGLTALATAANLATVAADVGSILLQTTTDGVQIDPDNKTEIAGLVWDEAHADHTNELSFGAMLQPQRTGTAQAGSANSITLDAGASAIDDFYKGSSIRIVGGTGAGQPARRINSYNGATKEAVINATWVTNPNATSVFLIIPQAAVDMASVNADEQQAIDLGAASGQIMTYLDDFVSDKASPAQVATEILDALTVDTYAEPGQGAPPATASIKDKLGYVYKFLRNKHTQTATTFSVFADDTTTVDHKATVSDDGTTLTRTEIASGP